MADPTPQHTTRSSRGILADRRFAWGEAAAREGDFAAAADLFLQTVEIAPDWAPAWLALGEAQQRLGEIEDAREAYARAAALDPSGQLGANLRLAALGAAAPPDAAPAAYVRDLFDQYAPRFNAHLSGALAYRGPALLRAAVEAACASLRRTPHFSLMLDLGCGAGLAAEAFHPLVDAIDGVDLSPAMIAEAARTGLYRQLIADGLVEFLQARAGGDADLVVAADVFVYIGDLAPALAACARALARGGLLAFSAQRINDGEWRLGGDLRYAHSRNYLAKEIARAGFDILSLDEASTRREAGKDTPGFIVVARRP